MTRVDRALLHIALGWMQPFASLAGIWYMRRLSRCDPDAYARWIKVLR